MMIETNPKTGLISKFFGGKTEAEPVVVVPKVAPDARIYAVGDVHGRVDLLEAMMTNIVFDIAYHSDNRVPQIILLGDYIDRGDHSKEVIDAMMSLVDTLPEERLRFLLGNHEAALLSFLQNPSERSEWLRFGGLQTLSSYGVLPPKSNPAPEDLVAVADGLRAAMGDHVDFMMTFERVIRSGDVVFAHAGLDPEVPIDAQNDEAVLWGRSDFLESGGLEGLRVVHGHYDAAQPVITPRRVCVDTGAYYSGRLTAIRLDADEKIFVADVADIMD